MNRVLIWIVFFLSWHAICTHVHANAVTGVTLDRTTLDFSFGYSMATLVATVSPSNSSNQDVTWSSSNESVVTVNQAGELTSVGAGSATITVTTVDGGLTDTCEVTVIGSSLLSPISDIAIPDPQAENSVDMANAAEFEEVKLNDLPIADGPYEPTWESIEANYPGTPEWLREAKFGLWVHFGPQAAGESGDWYARRLYDPDEPAYRNHLTNYGHPSEVGYKDVLRTWNPNELDPAALVQLYKDAGVRFLIIQGVHHDQFDLWDSQYQPWNAVRMGPKRDLVGEWASAARDAGMRFGLTFHHEYSWWWWQTAFQNDMTGAYANVPYDGNLTLAESRGTWWEGLNPRLLYGVNLREYKGVASAANSAWSPPPAGIFQNHLDYSKWNAKWWALRMMDAVDKYEPDFIYTDGTDQQPFSGFGTGTGYKSDAMQRVIADFYNKTLDRRDTVDVFSIVKFRHETNGTVNTEEGSIPGDIKTNQDWIAETPVGDWFYRPGFTYSSDGVIRYLLEQVARDGNVGLCVSLRPDGSLDAGSTTMLAEIGAWLAINGDGIYGSRAWEVLGEGANGQLNVLPGGKIGWNQANHPFSTSDFRFTVGKDGYLYAWSMAVPEPGETLNISSLGTSRGLLNDDIADVTLLGHEGTLTWSQGDDALTITFPASMDFATAVGLKIGPTSIVRPRKPRDLIAKASDTNIKLSWKSSDQGATYTVQRAESIDGTYTEVASGLADTNWVHSSPVPGTLYFYRVALTVNGATSYFTDPIGALLPDDTDTWTCADIGPVGAEGSCAQASNALVVRGSGADIWGQSDGFHYAYTKFAGNGTITAKVESMQNTAAWAKAGLMMRESLDADSKYVIHFISPTSGVALQQRVDTGGGASGVTGLQNVEAPYWIRLVRDGNTFTAFSALDGENWTSLGSTSISMSDPYYVGLAVTSHNDGAINQAVFNHVSITDGLPSDTMNSKIVWDAPVAVTTNDVILNTGTLVHAGNFLSNNRSISVSVGSETILFENRDRGNFVLGSDEARIIQGSGGRQVENALFDASGTSVDADFESVLDGSVWEDGDPGPAPGTTDMLLRLAGADGSPLEPGQCYQIQLFYSDDRGCCSARSQVYHDNTLSYIPSNLAVGGESNAVIGKFTAGHNGYQDIYVQNRSGEVNFPVAINAYVLQECPVMMNAMSSGMIR